MLSCVIQESIIFLLKTLITKATWGFLLWKMIEI